MDLSKPKRKRDDKLLEEIRKLPCCICGRKPVDVSHIKTRGSGGPDEFWNCYPKCRQHHIEWGFIGWVIFFQRHPHFMNYLKNDGWEIDLEKTKLWHPGLGKSS